MTQFNLRSSNAMVFRYHHESLNVIYADSRSFIVFQGLGKAHTKSYLNNFLLISVSNNHKGQGERGYLGSLNDLVKGHLLL